MNGIVRKALVISGALIILALGCMPFLLRTKTYPLTIVQGNSMFPALQNGDIVVFRGVANSNIGNGTVLIYVPGDTGVSAFDSFIRPVIIHRVIGTLIQPDGSICYRTKGDNNQVEDPALVPADHVLGVESYVVPKLGIMVLFIQSPQGLVATIGMISIYYIGRIDLERKEGQARNRLLGRLAEMLSSHEISQSLYHCLEPLILHSESINPRTVRNNSQGALLRWLSSGALNSEWRVTPERCPRCDGLAVRFTGSGEKIVLCACDFLETYSQNDEDVQTVEVRS